MRQYITAIAKYVLNYYTPPTILNRLPPYILHGVQPGKLEQLSPGTLEKLHPAVLAQLKPEVLGRLSLGALEKLHPAVLAQLKPEVLGRLSPTTLEKLDPTILERLPIPVLENLNPKVLKRLPWNVLIEVNPTLAQVPSYPHDEERGDRIYTEAFQRCLEYITYNEIQGDILEFGTFRGHTARVFATLMQKLSHQGTLYLYDSFEGLPVLTSAVDRDSYDVADRKVWGEGMMRPESGIHIRIQEIVSKIIPAEQVKVIKGYFEDTFESPESSKVSIVHVDCDLYASAKFVLDKLLSTDLLQDGCLLIFDDYNCNRANNNMGERLALVEAFKAQNRFSYSSYFSYGWAGHVFFVHDNLKV